MMPKAPSSPLLDTDPTQLDDKNRTNPVKYESRYDSLDHLTPRDLSDLVLRSGSMPRFLRVILKL